MEYAGWVLFVLSVVWYFKSTKFSHRKRLHQNYFIAYLLLDDAIREAQKKGFQDWIRAADAPDAYTLAGRAFSAIEGLADRLAAGSPDEPDTSSLLGAAGTIWEYKQRGKASPN